VTIGHKPIATVRGSRRGDSFLFPVKSRWTLDKGLPDNVARRTICPASARSEQGLESYFPTLSSRPRYITIPAVVGPLL
jgi:hypothetical protein